MTNSISAIDKREKNRDAERIAGGAGQARGKAKKKRLGRNGLEMSSMPGHIRNAALAAAAITRATSHGMTKERIERKQKSVHETNPTFEVGELKRILNDKWATVKASVSYRAGSDQVALMT